MIDYKELTLKLEKNSEKEKLYPSCSGAGRISRNFNNFVADNCSIIYDEGDIDNDNDNN
jgi:hypothetical protein